MAQTPRSPGGTTLAAFATAVMIGGTNFVAVRFSNEDLDPLFGASLRFGIAALIFFALVRLLHVPLPRGRALAGAAIYGFLGFGVAYGFLYYALVGLTAGTTSVILASSPLVTLAVAVLHGQETFSSRAIFGGALAIVGIGILSLGSLGGDLRPIYLISAFLGTLAIAASTVVIKDFPKAHPLATNAVGMPAGVIFLVVVSLAFRETWTIPSDGRTWLVLAWLVIVGSVILFQLFLIVIKSWSASATVYAIALMPVVTVILGALIADEPITLHLVAGVVLVMAAVYVGAIKTQPRALPAVPEAAASATDQP